MLIDCLGNFGCLEILGCFRCDCYQQAIRVVFSNDWLFLYLVSVFRKYDEKTCHDSLCEHGGKCPANDPDNPNCECTPGYMGRWCEHAGEGQSGSSSKWVGGRLRSRMGPVSLSTIIGIVVAVSGVLLVCSLICLVQCVKRRNAARKTKSAKAFKFNKQKAESADTLRSPQSTIDEEKSLLSPQASPRGEMGIGHNVSTAPSTRTPLANHGAPALAFNEY